jgi:hypothetical protein
LSSRSSANEGIVYVAVNSFDFGFGYLLALDSRTLLPINSVRLIDPQSGFDSTMADETSASPTVGPDGDLYYGVLRIPSRITTIEGGCCISG